MYFNVCFRYLYSSDQLILEIILSHYLLANVANVLIPRSYITGLVSEDLLQDKIDTALLCTYLC